MWEPDRKLFVVRIQVEGRYLNIGRFKNEVDAARAYNEAAVKHYGEFALSQ